MDRRSVDGGGRRLAERGVDGLVGEDDERKRVARDGRNNLVVLLLELIVEAANGAALAS